MKLLILALLLSQPAYSNWFEDRRLDKERRATEKVKEQMLVKEQLEKMRRRLWREKQYSKLFDGMKGFLSKGRFKYLTIGIMGGTILTASGIWYFCHDGCRFFNPPRENHEH